MDSTRRKSADRKAAGIVAIAIIALIGLWLIATSEAEADVLSTLDNNPYRIEYGQFMSGRTDDDDAEVEYGHRLTLGWKKFPVYVWGDLSDRESLNILGQNVTHNTETKGFGLGIDYEVYNGVKLFIEGGIEELDYDMNWWHVEEMPYTYLVGRHAVGDAQIPVTRGGCAYRGPGLNCFDSTLEYDDNYPVFRAGVSAQPWRYLKMYAAYKYARPDMYISISDSGGTWEENKTYNLSSFEAGLMVTF
jgi:hypothetical protein